MRKKLFTFLLALTASIGMMWAASNGKLSGAFSVDESTVVYFSQGNLQYTKSTGKWKIMDHQYDVVETLSQNVGTDYASQDVITLFGWGTSGWDNTAADATSVHYQPYSTSKTIHGTTNNNYQYEENDPYPFHCPDRRSSDGAGTGEHRHRCTEPRPEDQSYPLRHLLRGH